MLSVLLFGHLLVVVEFNLLHNHEVMPIDVLCHLAIFHICTILSFLELLNMLRVVKVGLPLLTGASALCNARLAFSKGLDAL